MTALLPMALYGLEVPAGDVAIPARPDIPAAFRITMAAIDPSAEPEGEEGQPLRATLKVIRQPLMDEFDDMEDDEDEDFDADEMDRILAGGDSEEDSEDDEDINGGPSDPAKSKKAQRAAAQKEIEKLLEEEGMDLDDLPNGVNGTKKSAKAKGKMPASEDDDEDEDDDDDDDIDSDEGGEIEEFVICTLDPTKNYQQPLDITIGDDERVWFKVSGTHTIYLTGNYVEPVEDHHHRRDLDDEDEEDYDLEPDSDELEYDDEEDSEDELDELEDPRIVEVDEDSDDAPALVKASKKADKKAGKNKRAAPEPSDDEELENGAPGLDELISKAAAAESKKQAKKLKKNDGAAGKAPAAEKAAAKKEVEAPSSNKSDKKVSFAKELEQGPTPTKGKNGTTAALGVKTIQGVTIDDKKLGTGQVAKSGDRVGMRYIGKLQKDGKVFDSNKKGKPFTFKLGAGEVIKGWDIGVAGMSAGGERRITIPAHHAYGSKSLPGIPSNSTLVFDIKMLEINKGK